MKCWCPKVSSQGFKSTSGFDYGLFTPVSDLLSQGGVPTACIFIKFPGDTMPLYTGSHFEDHHCKSCITWMN